MPGERHCFAHAPHLAAVRAEARTRGGHNRSNAVRAENAMPTKAVAIYERMRRVMDATEKGEITPRVCTAIAAAGRTALAALAAGEYELMLRAAEADRLSKEATSATAV